jgi:hypothetical protein
MATRENQGLQAFIIFLSLLTIGLLISLLLVNNARKTQKARADKAESDYNTGRTELSRMLEEVANYKDMLGFAEADTLEAIRTAFDADMVLYAAAMAPESRKYRRVLESIFDERNTLAVNLAAAQDEIKALKASLLAVQTEKDEQFKQYEEEMETVRADAAEERTEFTTDRERMATENDAIQKQMDELRAAHDAAIAELEAKRQDLETQILKLQQSIEKLRLGLPEVDQFAQPADGRIILVNQRSGTVWLDLGEADGLRPQVTFSVAEPGLDDAAAAEKKGSIEVVRVLGPHSAEAHITSDDPLNPLLRGDRVYSQVWDRGRQVGFGIAGFIDVDGDRTSDLDKLKAIIAANGGVVDAAPDGAGVKQGEMKVSTRYLILGDYPDTRQQALITSWGELSEEAESLGIQTIALDEFLALMGWQREARSVPMGPGARAEDFPPQPLGEPMPRRTGQPSGVGKRRLPVTPY